VLIIEEKRKLVFRKVKSEEEELPPTIQRHIEISKNQLLQVKKSVILKISESYMAAIIFIK